MGIDPGTTTSTTTSSTRFKLIHCHWQWSLTDTLLVVVLQEVLSHWQLSFLQVVNSTTPHCGNFKVQKVFRRRSPGRPHCGTTASGAPGRSPATPRHLWLPPAACFIFRLAIFKDRGYHRLRVCSVPLAAAAINRPNHSTGTLPWLPSFIPLLSNGGQFIYTASSESKKHIGIPTFGLLVALLLPCQ